MGTTSAIAWTDFTSNEWEGCTKVSPACAHCYAATRNARNLTGPESNWGAGAPRRRNGTAARNVSQKVAAAIRTDRYHRCDDCGQAFIRTPSKGCAQCGPGTASTPMTRARCFSASLSDWLDDDGVPVEWLANLLHNVRTTADVITWQLLTKRPENWARRMMEVHKFLEAEKPGKEGFSATTVMLYRWLESWMQGDPPENVWVGVTAENADWLRSRMPHLTAIPARVRFLSCEPLLGPITARSGIDWKWINWIIAGGESGPGWRETPAEWFLQLKQLANARAIPFFMKQMSGLHPHKIAIPDHLQSLQFPK